MNLRPVLANRQFATAVATLGLLASIGRVQAQDLSLPVTGELLGTVMDGAGTPQMGAVVQILNKYRRVVSRGFTDADGRFVFAGLTSDSYSVRVSAASFLPASRDQILVKAGVNSVLEIHLATLLSNIEVSYKVPTGGMSNDWKWVLRASPATRLVTRVLPVDFPEPQPTVRPRVFSETHAMLAVSGGDSGLIDNSEIGADLGTAFALSTNVLGKNQVQVAGALGQTAEFGPAAIALCAIYSRTGEDSPFAAPPEVTFRLAQLGGLGAPLGAPLGTGFNNSASLTGGVFPVLRTMSLALYHVADPLESVHLEYGATGEEVEYVQHTSRLSPFARLTLDLGWPGKAIASYTDGGRPDELLAHQQYRESELDGRSDDDDLSGPLQNLSRLPQISNRDGRLQMQRTQAYELGYSKSLGTLNYSISGFSEVVWNGRLNVAGDLSPLNQDDLFSDGISTTSSYNVGKYERAGYVASVDQRVSQSLDVALAYGRMGGFTPDSNGPDATGWSPGSRFLDEKQHNLATVSTRAIVPHVGTRVTANYGWIDAHTVMPQHLFTTQDVISRPGLNILVRQPLPSFFGIPGRLELTADLRNLLADGYTSVNTGNGTHLLLVEAPRAIRGGLKFTF